MPLHTEENTSVWGTLRDETGLSPCEIRPMTYIAGAQPAGMQLAQFKHVLTFVVPRVADVWYWQGHSWM